MEYFINNDIGELVNNMYAMLNLIVLRTEELIIYSTDKITCACPSCMLMALRYE